MLRRAVRVNGITALSHGMGLLKPKTRSIVGLDIEPGFVAAAEFTNGGTPRLVKAATAVLGPGLFHEGEVVDVDGLSDKLRAPFPQHALPKRLPPRGASPNTPAPRV